MQSRTPSDGGGRNPRAARGALLCWTCLVLLFTGEKGFAQGSAGTGAAVEPRYVVDVPTAGIIPNGNLALDLDFYESGGVLLGASVAALDRVLVGISYGGTGVIGSGRAVGNPLPGFVLKIRVLDETVGLPAIALGFDSQGKESYITVPGRYTVKSPGFYAVLSKNYAAAGFLSLHGGVNYSLERSDGDRDLNLFAGIEKSAGPIISLLSDYSLGANDSNRGARGRGRGYLNFGLHASLGKGLTLGLHLKDLLQNQQNVTLGNRTLQIEYVQPL